MNLQEFTPENSLKPYIKCYRIIESKEGQINQVLPNTSPALAFCLKGQISYINEHNIVLPTAVLSGLRKSIQLIKYAPQTTTIIVLFNEMGLSSLIPKGTHELYEQSVSMDNYFSRHEIEILQERLTQTENNVQRIELVERFLRSKLRYFKTDTIIAESISRIHSVYGNLRIKELISNFGISQDAFEKRFRKSTGATPKQFAHIVKMNSAIRQYQTRPSFLDLAFENGYYDQSHFNKDFKIFTGQTPTTFFSTKSYW